MKVELYKFGLIAVAIVTGAVVHILCNNLNFAHPRIACGSTEVFRWSDESCYVPQGE